jgi:hypothetical protein
MPCRLVRFVSQLALLHRGQIVTTVFDGIQRWPQRRQWSLGSAIFISLLLSAVS